METTLDINACWQRGKARETARTITANDLRSITVSRVKKQFKTVAAFVWASLAHQIILYSFLSYALVRNWGNTPVMLLGLTAASVYVPLTTMLLRRARALYSHVNEGSSDGVAAADIAHHVRAQRDRLADFFRFKQRLDFIGVPVGCAIVVLVTFTLFVGGGVAAHPVASAAVFAVWIGMSAMAVSAENRRRFAAPIRHLDAVIGDLERV